MYGLITPSGSSQVGLRDVFRARGTGWLRRVLQPQRPAHQPGRVILQHMPGNGHGAHGAGSGEGPAGHEDTAGVHTEGQAIKPYTTCMTREGTQLKMKVAIDNLQPLDAKRFPVCGTTCIFCH